MIVAAGYTLAGALASAAVGGVLGAAGQATPFPWGPVGLSVVAIVACAGALRELDVLHLPLLQPRRQTNQCWKVHGRRTAAVMWGFDLGLVFTTWFTFAGVWALVALSVMAKNPALGAAVFLAYWAGRALPVWLGPRMLRDLPTLSLLSQLSKQYRTLRVLHASALLWLAAVATAWAAVRIQI